MVWLSIVFRNVPGSNKLHMSFFRPLELDISWRHKLASFSWVFLSSTQNKLFPHFWGSKRKSRKDRCRGLTGISSLTGTLRTECRESSLHLTLSLEILRRCASEVIERGLSKTRILPTISWNSEICLCWSLSSSSLINKWFKMGRYVLSRFETVVGVWYPSMISKRFLGLSRSSPIYRQAVAAKMNNGIASLTRAWSWALLGQSEDNKRCSRISRSSCSRKRVMSCSTVSFGTSWRTKSWYVPSGICMKPWRIGSAGLLVTKTRNETGLKARVCARSRRISLISFWLSHSSNASMTTKNSSEVFVAAGCISSSGWRINFSNWSFKVFSEISGSTSIALLMPDINLGTWIIRSLAMVVKNLEALPRSPSPLLKKKLAPSCCWPANDWATVRAIVDFPVPAMPFNQYMGLPFLSLAHSVMWRSSSTLVSARHLGLCSSTRESKDAPLAIGNLAKSIFLSMLCIRKLQKNIIRYAWLPQWEIPIGLTFDRLGARGWKSAHTHLSWQRYFPPVCFLKATSDLAFRAAAWPDQAFLAPAFSSARLAA